MTDTPQPFTVEDADRLLGLADQFLEDWAEDAIQAGQPDPDYEERMAEFTAIRTLLMHAPALLQALQILRTDMLMLQSGAWVPDDDSIQASIDVCETAITAAGAEPDEFPEQEEQQ
jgi:hypothetical protein